MGKRGTRNHGRVKDGAKAKNGAKNGADQHASSFDNRNDQSSRKQRVAKFSPILILVLFISVFGLGIMLYWTTKPQAQSPEKSSSSSSSQEPIVERFSFDKEPRYLYPKQLAQYAHDSTAFTQGLHIYKGNLYESTGLYGSSSLRQVDLKTGQIVRKHDLEQSRFGEGITIWNDKIYMLTWRSGDVLIFNMDFQQIKKFKIHSQGWGITHNEKHLIISDGSDKLYYYSPKTYTKIKTVNVRKVLPKARHDCERTGGNCMVGPQTMINELEMIKGFIYANIWHSPLIAMIDPTTHYIVNWIDIGALHEVTNREAVANGIAWDVQSQQMFVTGKLWDSLYEIEPLFPDVDEKYLKEDMQD